MGYRSDVGLLLSKHGVSVLHARLNDKSLPEETRQDVLEFMDRAVTHFQHKATGAEAWLWQWVKWYDTDPYAFPDVKFIAETIRDLPDEDYRFIRVGEDYEDTEVEGDFFDHPFGFDVVRSIVVTPSQE